MIRDEWIRRYVSAMKAGGSPLQDWHLVARAEQGCDATEQTNGPDPDFWEDPEIIASEDLVSE
jgi:hypothetical protein